MNKNTKRKKATLRASGAHFHGKACDTGFGSPNNRNKSARKGFQKREA